MELTEKEGERSLNVYGNLIFPLSFCTSLTPDPGSVWLRGGEDLVLPSDQLVMGQVLKNEDVPPFWSEVRETSLAHDSSCDLSGGEKP